MALQDPVAVYSDDNKLEVHSLRGFLVAAGIEAFVTDADTPAGDWMGGLLPEEHRPQVWIERADVERAKPILEEFEGRAAERPAAAELDAATHRPVEVACEECGKTTAYSHDQVGSVQSCSHCGAYVDVVLDDRLGE